MSKIMVVDDSNFMRRLLKRTLQQNGYNTIFEAANGEEAIDVYMYTKPDLVIMDITMPDINGLMVLKNLLAFNPKAKVIMCSSMGTQTNLLEAKKNRGKGICHQTLF